MDALSKLEEYLRRGELVQAMQEAERLLLTPDLTDRQKGSLYRMAGRVSGELFGPHAGMKLLEMAVPLALRSRDWDTLGAVRADLGTFWLMAGDNSNAAECGQAYLLDFHRYKKATPLLGHVHYNLALAYRRLRNYSSAAEHYRAAVDWFTEKGYTLRAGQTHQNLAWMHCLMNDPESAQMEIDLAETFAPVCGESFKIEQMLCRSFVLRLAKNPEGALLLVREVLQPGRAHATDSHRANAAWIGGSVALDLRNYDEALYYADLATKYALKAKDTGAMSQASKLKGDAVRRKQRGDQAAQ